MESVIVPSTPTVIAETDILSAAFPSTIRSLILPELIYFISLFNSVFLTSGLYTVKSYSLIVVS